MDKKLISVIFIFFLVLVDFSLANFWWLREGGNHVKKSYWTSERKTYVRCKNLWSWGRCTKYRTKHHSALACDDGWIYKSYADKDCSYAICDGKTNFNGACNIYYSDDQIITRSHSSPQRSSGGSCTSPNNCINCNDGFYSDGPNCRICSKISNCNHRRCTTATNQKCMYCEGDVASRPYWRAYTPEIDDAISCQKTCNWRADSTRCYPGTCANELADNCKCSGNFTGNHCEKIMDDPTIAFNHAAFYDKSKLHKLENDPNYVGNDIPVYWTNFVGFSTIETSMAAKYLQPPDIRDADHYVTAFRVGLIVQKLTVSFYKNGMFESSQVEECSGMDRDLPVDTKHCSNQFILSYFPTTLHNDKIMFAVSAKNGGYLDVHNRETDGVNRYYYEGRTLVREFEFHWDLVNPYHCSVTQGLGCDAFASVKSDITDNPNITLSFGGWADDLSGLSYYDYDVYELGHNGVELIDGMSVVISQTKIHVDNRTNTFTVPRPGAYSLHFFAFDKAGNYKTGRALFLFDDQSVVDKYDHQQTICSTSSQNTSYQWVVTNTDTLQIIWTDRFINTRHEDNRWLNEVQTFSPSAETSIYEDLYGNRTNKLINNQHGIVDFQVSFDVHSPLLKDSRPLTSVSDIHNQYDILKVNWTDGDRLTSTVRALDVLGKFNEDTIIIYRDATPPVIENLWLTRGDRVNISVHRIEDFTEMIIEWEAYDDHSGLDYIYWKLYDKYGGTEVLHGHEDIITQGGADALEECENMYKSYARGAYCYCTPFMGCYHRHFQVKPEIKAHGGLIHNLYKGVHDYDYHIDISVTNKANITTLLTKKITIDISPPHAGVVHDGIVGSPEVDYQQELTIRAYWDQFFDRESGVFFYQYIVGSSCANKDNFDLELTHPNVVETYDTFASVTVSSEGTYYFTVIAYNRALEPSDPVCSDGVTIDTSVPSIEQVAVENARIVGGLIKETSKYYILGSDRNRRLISNPTTECVDKATEISDIDLYPLEQYDNGTIVEVNGTVFCQNSTGAPSNIGITVSKSSMMEISWVPVLVPGQIYDYEVGLSTTSGSSAPDLLAFQSTKQHAHYFIMHSNIPDGMRFFIVIKTISKSNKEGITSIGPCFVDTTPPDFTGSISLTLSGDYLLATWAADAFVDSEDLYDLDYEFSVGHEIYSTDVQGFIPLREGGGCLITTPPICTAVKIIDLDWYLHGHHTYFISIKVTNTAGLATIQASSPYIHDVQLPAEGLVLDIDSQNFTTDIPLKDIEDIDFQSDKTSIASRWSGFAHPHLDVTYKVSIGSTKGGSNMLSLKDVGIVTAHKETGLLLDPLKKYFVTVTAVTSAGSISVSSDGVTIVTENAVLPGVMIYDGKPCNMTDFTLNHHEEDHRFPCPEDIDVQMSLNSIKAYWTVPEDIQTYTFDALFAIERRSSLGDMWFPFHGFDYVSTVFDITVDDLTLSPGTMYRVVLKLCANTICFQTISTDGVMVMSSPPATGAITLQHLNLTVGGGTEKLLVTFDQFYDPDIENIIEKYDAVPTYEYAITDNSLLGKMYTPWTSITSQTINNHKVSFEVPLIGEMDFSRCKRLTIRGYNKAKHYSIVSTEIKDCAAYNPILINPNIVIDAIGQPDLVDGIGRTIYLTKNDYWTEADQDYTPYKNVISAVWPTLRHRSYTYAVLNAKTIDVTTYYRQINQLSLKDPCDHPDAIKCGATNSEFMNVEFGDGELVHGTRYTVCVHANPRVIEYEMWTDVLPEVNSCSDGIIVDFTPPVEGRVWIGNIPTITHQTVNTDMYVNWDGFVFQTVTSDMYVNWDGFYDVEEYNNGPHSTGIKEYILGIGTTSGGNDVFPFENVGTVQHKALHGLNLQNGYKYYATIKAVDFANRETTVMSDPVIVDITPPDKSNDPITITNLHITSTTEIEACWKNVFTDLESGIDYFLWSIGSEPGYVDMMPYVTVLEGECDTTDKNNPLDLIDGHYYYINVRAFNKAGLSSLSTSWAFQVDTTPPTPGHVYDGDNTVLTGDVKDIDYQTETKVIHVYWEGFHDTHSIIQEYYVSVGTCPQCEDVLTEQAVGITNEFSLKDIHLGTGLHYYTTVTACNTASMCTSVTSDGVVMDNSPPIAGHVQDGTGFYDTQYQSMRTYISAKWYGFDDPQSGLQKYEWRAGTSIGGDDIVSPTELHLTEVLALNDLSLTLPLNQKIYLTIRAYNRAGLWTESSSNGFIVDITAPVVSTSLTFAKDYGINGLTQIYRNSMKVEWNINDPESFINRQYLSISSHIGGEFNLSSIQVNGIARWYVITGLDLHDGVTYYVTLISCNGAEICITSTSPGMFVDSSKPSRGMFAIDTDHAVNSDLSRHSDGWMTWTSTNLFLAWLGFSDAQSGIDHYKVTVGSSYMATDVGKKPDAKYIHSTANEDNGDEGKVQLFKVQTKGLINYDILYVTIWTVNGVGLRSDLIYSAFRRVPGGALELIRRCDSMSCEGHCVCAPQDQKCPTSPSLKSCTDISSNNSNSILLVMDSNGYSSTDLSFTSSANVLRGQWIISQSQGLAPLWYEWSVGYTGYSTPTGIYNLVDEKNWQDGGQFTDGVYITNKGVNLIEHSSYSFYVRIWYTVDTYAVFKSDGITVFSQTPPVASVRGKVVTEKTLGTNVKDQDFIQTGRPMVIDWSGKFLEAENLVQKYKIYLSTYPGGHDIWTGSDEVPGSATGYNISRLNLIPCALYFTNVVAYTYSGVHTTVTSDGFIVDVHPPVSGVVYDGIGRSDLEYQNSSDFISARWHGFIDTDSGVKEYRWCVGTTVIPVECSVIGWTNVGLHVSVTRNLSSSITQGSKIYSKVYAIDNVGLSSDTAISDGVVIDTTKPVSEKFLHADVNLVSNPSFENTSGSEIMWEDVNSTDICMLSYMYYPSSWTPESMSCLAVVSSDVNLAKDGRSFLFIRGSAHQRLENIIAGTLYKVSFFSSHLPIWNSVAANKQGFIQLGDHSEIFLIYTKAYRRDNHGDSSREEVSWHKHTYYIKADEENVNLTIGSADQTTGLIIDDLSVQEVTLESNDISGGHILGHVVYIHEWGSIHGSWSFADPESPIIDYSWAIGYAEGGTQIQPFRSVGVMNFGYNNNITLVHNVYIYIIVIATNTAGLRGVAYSDPILVDLTPPDINFINDGLSIDEDSWILNEVSAKWEVEDLQSGIKECKWAIGYLPERTDLQIYTTVSGNTGSIEFDYSVLEGYTVYSTLSCENNAGLSSVRSTDGVRITEKRPSTDHAEVEVVGISSTQYNPQTGFLGVTDNIRLKWSGFIDNVGIDAYVVDIGGDRSDLMFFPTEQDLLYTHFSQMSIASDIQQKLSVQAVNKVFLRSDKVRKDLMVYLDMPQVDATKTVSVSWTDNKFMASWESIFLSDHQLYYEVSAGTHDSGVNILQWQYTNQTSVTFGLPGSVQASSGLKVHITIGAISTGGFYNFVKGTVILP